MRRILGFIDWRFVASLAVLILVVALVRSSLAAAEDRDRAIAQGIADRKAAEVERAEASAERQRLLQGQRDLEGKYERLVVWLNEQGIVVPPSVLNGRPDRDDDDDGDDSDDSDDDSQKGSGKQSPPKSGPTAPPAQPDKPRPESNRGGNGRGQGSGQGHSEERGRPNSPGRSESRPTRK